MTIRTKVVFNIVCVAAAVLFALPEGTFGQSLTSAIVAPVVEGQFKVGARVHAVGDWTLKVSKAKDKAGKAAPLPLDSVLSVAAADRGDLLFDLTEKLKALAGDEGAKGLKVGWILELFGPPAGSPSVSTVTVTANKVEINLNPPREGDDVVTGTVFGTADKVRVYVQNSRGVVVQSDEDSVTDKKFSLGLRERLAENQTVRVVALNNGEEVGATADYALVEGVSFEFGRVRSYFSLGSTLAAVESDKPVLKADNTVDYMQRSRSFTSADYSVGLNVDYNWLTSLTDNAASGCDTAARNQEDLIQLERLVDDSDGADFLRRFGGRGISEETQFNRAQAAFKKFAETLQAITKDMKTSLVSDDKCLRTQLARVEILESSTDEFTRVKDTNAELATAATKDPTMVKTQLTRMKEAFGYLDKALEEYRHSDPGTVRHKWQYLINSSFEARAGQAPVAVPAAGAAPAVAGQPAGLPSATAILQKANTLMGGLTIYAPIFRQSLTWHFQGNENALFIAPLFRSTIMGLSSETKLDTAGKEVNPINRSLYVSRAAGFRFGHFKLAARRKTVAPELLSYLDVSAGKFDNFRSGIYQQAAPVNGVGQPVIKLGEKIPWRLDAEARFKIPQTPLSVGFNANWGQGQDDIRFFFGTRFDVAKALSKLIPSSKQ